MVVPKSGLKKLTITVPFLFISHSPHDCHQNHCLKQETLLIPININNWNNLLISDFSASACCPFQTKCTRYYTITHRRNYGTPDKSFRKSFPIAKILMQTLISKKHKTPSYRSIKTLKSAKPGLKFPCVLGQVS